MATRNLLPDLLITLAMALIVLMAFYQPLVLHPGDYSFVSTGDGLKNYFTFSYFLENNSNFHNTCMNYPYGEFAAYTDNHPILAEWYAFIHRNILNLNGQAVALVNLHTLMSPVFACLIFLLIFRHYNIYGVWAIVGSIFISFFSPQILRYSGHFSLAHLYFFPLVWLLILTIPAAKYKNILTGLLTIALVVMGLIHAYHLFIGLMFLAFYILITLCIERKVSKSVIHYTIGLISAAVIFLVVTKLYDNVIDRPKYPFGIDYYITSWAGTLLPYTGQFADWLSEHWHLKNDKFESNGYLGLASILVLFCGLIFWIWRNIKSRKFTWPNSNIPKSLVISLFAAFAVWIFGTNLLNEVSGDLLYKIMPPLRQFRGLGRLSWVLYYVGCFYAIVLFRSYFIKTRGPYRIILLLVLSSIWTYEIISLNTSTAKIITKPNTLLHNQNNPYYNSLIAAGVKFEDFQAILSLPFCHIGNEKIAVLRGDYTISRAMGLSYCTGLPMINSMMSRTSISQAMSQIQLIQDVSLHKERLKDFTNQDLLLVFGPGTIIESEEILISQAEFLSEHGDFKFYRLPVSALYKKDMTAFETDSLFTPITISDQTMYVNDPQDSFLLLTTHDTHKDVRTFLGDGSLEYTHNSDSIFFSYDLPKGNKPDLVLASMWIYIDYMQPDMPQFNFIVLGAQKNLLFEKPVKYYNDPVPYKSWVHYEMIMEPGKEKRTFQLVLTSGTIRVDEILVRSHQNNTYRKTDGLVLKNNLPVYEID